MRGHMCDFCEKIAVKNVQTVWAIWDYDPETGEYSDTCKIDYEGIPDEPNLHLCQEHYEVWQRGEYLRQL